MSRRTAWAWWGLALTLLANACSARSDDAEPVSTTAPSTTSAPATTTTEAPTPVVIVGAQRLVDSGFLALAGSRVGLIANQTSLVRGRHLIDELYEAPDVDLVAVFAPEHGIRGTEGAGVLVDDDHDPQTGVRIYSLYGDTRQPTPEMLEGIDTLVYDLQDVGGRFYTYISTMGLAMQAANAAGVRFVVLDRPDPSGLTGPSGYVLDDEYVSFVGQYAIPAAYAMTPGELARMIVGEGLIDGVDGLRLDVIPLGGWKRGMTWEQTGLEWVAPSPGLQTPASAVTYLGTVLLEATSISFGGGTLLTFEQVGAPWADAERVVGDLRSRGLPGVSFEPASFRPGPLPGRTAEPRLNGELVHGARIVVEDPQRFDPVAVGVHVLEVFLAEARRNEVLDDAYFDRTTMMTLLAGTPRLADDLLAGQTATDIVAGWAAELAAFDEARSRYLLY